MRAIRITPVAQAFIDKYQVALLALVEAKKAGVPHTPDAPPAPSTVINLLDVLKKSIQQDGVKKGGKAKKVAMRLPHG